METRNVQGGVVMAFQCCTYLSPLLRVSQRDLFSCPDAFFSLTSSLKGTLICVFFPVQNLCHDFVYSFPPPSINVSTHHEFHSNVCFSVPTKHQT